MKVKICGITNLQDALAACEAGADALGFNFAQEAKARNRYIDPEAAELIAEELPPFVAKVAVCVNETTETMAQYLKFCDYIQLHGEESPEQCAALGGRAIKVFRVAEGFNADSLGAYSVAAYLFDAYVPGQRGGTGTALDWDAMRKFAPQAQPLILAGGLTPDNVAEAIAKVRPYAVDTAGGVEHEPGKKDHERIRRFIDNAKASLS